MPLYEYSCPKCHNEIEIIQRVGESAPFCKKCGAKLKKLISCSNFFLIGSGWSDDNYSKPKKIEKKEKT